MHKNLTISISWVRCPCCCFEATVHTFICQVNKCTDGFFLIPGAAIVSYTHIPLVDIYIREEWYGCVLHTHTMMLWETCKNCYMKHHMDKIPGLTFLHTCAYLAVCDTKWVNTRIASCIPQAWLLLRCIAGYYYGK